MRGRTHEYPVVEAIPVFLDEEMVAGEPQYTGQRAYFDAELSSYERYALENWRLAYLGRLRAAGVLAGPAPLVDVGVGVSGYTVIKAARAGRPAIGCDLSLQGLLAARRFARAEDIGEDTVWSAARWRGFRSPPARSARRSRSGCSSTFRTTGPRSASSPACCSPRAVRG